MTQQMPPSYAPPAYSAPAAFAPTPDVPPPGRRRRTGLIAAVTGGLATLGLAGGALVLFGTPLLDTAEVADRIAADTQTQIGVAATDVSCPEDIEVAAGTGFSCTARIDGQPVTYSVRQTDDEGTVQFELDDEIVLVAKVEQAVAELVAADYGLTVSTVCDGGEHRVLVQDMPTSVPCTVTNVDDPADTLDVTADVSADGSVSYTEA
jgi:Domain of unknown function (DUF4333)